MKLVPISLEESQNFERGLDPKKSMSIGVAQKMKKMLSHIHMQPRMATHDYFSFLGGVPENENIIYAVKSVLWKILYDGLSPDVAFEKACKEWMLPEYDTNFVKEVLKRELNLNINEGLNFERGIDPKTSMKIGDAAILPDLIDSNVLEAVSMDESGLNSDDWGDRSQEEMDADDKMYALVQRVKRFIKGKVTFERYFDWKEEDEMEEFIRKNAKGRYVYNATPGSDGWQVVFSKIYFPRAEAIEV
jgi:hypothetical protein